MLRLVAITLLSNLLFSKYFTVVSLITPAPLSLLVQSLYTFSLFSSVLVYLNVASSFKIHGYYVCFLTNLNRCFGKLLCMTPTSVGENHGRP